MYQTSKCIMVTDQEKFRDAFMPKACEKYNYLKWNRYIDSLEFTLHDFGSPQDRIHPDRGGFDMEHVWGRQLIEDEMLHFLENEGLIERMPSGIYGLTDRGKKYCKEKKLI